MSDTPETDDLAEADVVFDAMKCHPMILERLEAWRLNHATIERERDVLRQQVTALQRALAFWMPAIAGSSTEAGERAAEDAYLLIGYMGPLEKDAEELGWVRASVFARGEGEIIGAGEVIKSRGLPFRLVYHAEVESANSKRSGQ